MPLNKLWFAFAPILGSRRPWRTTRRKKYPIPKFGTGRERDLFLSRHAQRREVFRSLLQPGRSDQGEPRRETSATRIPVHSELLKFMMIDLTQFRTALNSSNLTIRSTWGEVESVTPNSGNLTNPTFGDRYQSTPKYLN